MKASFKPLFYAAELKTAEVRALVQGLAEEKANNLVEFPKETGGTADQNLAVPFLQGMDEIEAEEARIVLRAFPKQLEVEEFAVHDNGSRGQFLSLPKPGRLKKVEFSFEISPGVNLVNLHLVIRGATAAGSSFTAGVPLFCDANLGSAGPMYGPTLPIAPLTNLGGNKRLVTLPSTLGSAWLIQYANGTKAEELSPADVTITIKGVTLDAAPRNLSVALLTRGSEVQLWNNPESLFPEAGEQEVSFTPLAQRHLNEALKASTDSPTLSVPLRFKSDAGGAIDVVSSTLTSEYLVRPVGQEPVTLQLRGDLVPVVLKAPAGLTPKNSSVRLTAKLLGRELNASSPEPTLQVPGAGLRVVLNRSVAASTEITPLAGEPAGSTVKIVSVRVCIACYTKAELVLELRMDVAGLPGPAIAVPIVKEIDPGPPSWIEFELPQAVEVLAGQAPVWPSLRVNKGEVFWLTSGAPADKSRVSADRGQTWGKPDGQIGATGTPLAQIFQNSSDPPPAPVLRLEHEGSILKSNLLENAAIKSGASPPPADGKSKPPTEYVLENGTLPNVVHSLLAGRTGAGKIETRFHLFSRSALDLTLENFTIHYDPFEASKPAI